MFKKRSLLALALSALMALSLVSGCASSASSDSSSASDASAQTETAQRTIDVSVEIDPSAAEGSTDVEGVAPERGPVDYDLDMGSTAYDALVATGARIEGTTSYVTSINGLAAGAVGTTSGWTFSVNGEMPTVAADAYVLQDGDAVEWSYMTSWDES